MRDMNSVNSSRSFIYLEAVLYVLSVVFNSRYILLNIILELCLFSCAVSHKEMTVLILWIYKFRSLFTISKVCIRVEYP